MLISYLSQCCYQTVSIFTRQVLDAIALRCILYFFTTSCKRSNVQVQANVQVLPTVEPRSTGGNSTITTTSTLSDLLIVFHYFWDFICYYSSVVHLSIAMLLPDCSYFYLTGS